MRELDLSEHPVARHDSQQSLEEDLLDLSHERLGVVRPRFFEVRGRVSAWRPSWRRGVRASRRAGRRMLWSEGRWVEIEARVIVLGRCKIDRSNTDDEKEEYVFHTLSGKPIRRLKVVLEPAQLLSYSEALKGAFNLEAFERLAIGRACEDDELA